MDTVEEPVYTVEEPVDTVERLSVTVDGPVVTVEGLVYTVEGSVDTVEEPTTVAATSVVLLRSVDIIVVLVEALKDAEDDVVCAADVLITAVSEAVAGWAV